MTQNITAVIDNSNEPSCHPGRAQVSTKIPDLGRPAGAAKVVRMKFLQEPLVGPRRGRRNLYVPRESVAGSHAELLALYSDDPANLNAVATTMTATVRLGSDVLRVRMSDLGAARFRQYAPVQRPAAYPTMTYYIGKFVVENEDGPHAVWFNSRNELDHLTHLEWEGVQDMNTQCVQFSWSLPSGRSLHHVPDIVKHQDGRAGVVDVTAADGLTMSKAVVFELTARSCRHFGWDYEVGLDNVSIARQRNLRYLRAFRRQPRPAYDWGDEPHPNTLWGLVQAYGGDDAAWKRALAHLWYRQLGFDPDTLLDDATVLLDTPASAPRVTWGVAK